MTAEALAAEFEVSVRTIYRDVDQLSAAGVPIFGARGPGGGVQLLDGYRTNLTGLATDEAEAMFMIGMPGPAAALGLGPAAARAGRKLLASLPKSWSRDAQRMGARFHLDPVDWYRTAEPVAHLPAIARAVLAQRHLAMTYESWTGTKQREIQPLGLVLKAGTWYVVARSGKAVRIFKVANILEHTVMEATFEYPEDFDLPAFWSAELARFEAGLRPGSARLRASALGLMRLAQWGAYAARAVQQAGMPDPEGWAQLDLPIENVEQAALALLALGPEVKVLEPVAVRDRLRAHAEQVVRRNS